jgi:hypothetical protein
MIITGRDDRLKKNARPRLRHVRSAREVSRRLRVVLLRLHPDRKAWVRCSGAPAQCSAVLVVHCNVVPARCSLAWMARCSAVH